MDDLQAGAEDHEGRWGDDPDAPRPTHWHWAPCIVIALGPMLLYSAHDGSSYAGGTEAAAWASMVRMGAVVRWAGRHDALRKHLRGEREARFALMGSG